MNSWLVAVLAIAGVSLSQPPPAGAESNFVSERSSISIHGDELIVRFEEAGLAPGSSAQIEIAGERTLKTTCMSPTVPDRVMLRTSSQATAAATGTYVADDDGVIRASRVLDVRPGRVALGDSACRTEEELRVTLRDLTHGSGLTLTA